MRHKRTLLTLLPICIALGCASALGRESVLVHVEPNFQWPQSASGIPKSNMTPRTRVQGFVARIASELGSPPLKVGSFVFAPLEQGAPSLVATVDASGRDLFYALAVISPVKGGFRYCVLTSVAPHFLPSEVTDLNGRGLDEVITRELAGSYRGARTDPIYWYTVYAFHGGKPQDVSAQYPDFYRSVVLPPLVYLQSIFDWMRTSIPRSRSQEFSPGSPEIELAEIGFVLLKYQRAILGNKNAGLDDALGWARSSTPDIALLGVRSLSEMTAPEAWTEIDKLRGAPDYAVCMEARMAWLKRLGKPFTVKDVCPRPGARRP